MDHRTRVYLEKLQQLSYKNITSLWGWPIFQKTRIPVTATYHEETDVSKDREMTDCQGKEIGGKYNMAVITSEESICPHQVTPKCPNQVPQCNLIRLHQVPAPSSANPSRPKQLPLSWQRLESVCSARVVLKHFIALGGWTCPCQARLRK